jgi:hypothetical protein
MTGEKYYEVQVEMRDGTIKCPHARNSVFLKHIRKRAISLLATDENATASMIYVKYSPVRYGRCINRFLK